MTTRVAAGWVAAFLLAACAAPGEEAMGPGQEAAPAATAKGEKRQQPKVVCEEEETVGTHFTHRVCRRVDQVDLQRDMTQDALRSRYNTNTKQGG